MFGVTSPNTLLQLNPSDPISLGPNKSGLGPTFSFEKRHLEADSRISLASSEPASTFAAYSAISVSSKPATDFEIPSPSQFLSWKEDSQDPFMVECYNFYLCELQTEGSYRYFLPVLKTIHRHQHCHEKSTICMLTYITLPYFLANCLNKGFQKYSPANRANNSSWWKDWHRNHVRV